MYRKQGSDAYNNGVNWIECPYLLNKGFHWLDGWIEAEDEARGEIR